MHMPMELFPGPEKEKSFLERHRSVIDVMKSIGEGVTAGVLAGVVTEAALNHLLEQGAPLEAVGSAVSIGAIVTILALKRREKK